MKILAFEFSSALRSIAIGDGKSVICRSLDPDAGKSCVLGFVGQLLCKAGLEREQIDCVAVGRGPGSYTGVRSAIALAQGWQLARQIQVQGISSVECLAVEAHRRGITGVVSMVVDAQRGEFHLITYSVTPTGFSELEPLRLASLEEILEKARAGNIIGGPEVNKWFASGLVLFPRASALVSLVRDRHKTASAEGLEPIYLREISFVKAPPTRNSAS